MNQDIRQIAQMLADRAEDVCHHLLPGGKKNGGEWECGSTAGEKGKSCKVRLSGDRAGVWCDFSNGEDKGDMIDLWKSSRNVTMGEAIKEAKGWLGIKEPVFEPPRKTYARPKLKPDLIAERALKYLMSERKLLRSTLIAFKVGTSSGGEFMAFPSYDAAGQLLNVKHIGVDRDHDGKKVVRTERDCAPALFGWQAFGGGRTIAITEGEIDALTMNQYGIPALSVPFGSGNGKKNDWIDFEWDNLAQFETIYLCYDNDAAGQSSVEEVAKRLGIHRCRSVILPHKDANECLQQGITDDEIEVCLHQSKTFDPPEIRSPMEFRDRVQAYFYPTKEDEAKVYTPIIFKKKVSFRPGELTVWTGCNSHGKSVMIGQIMIGAVLKGMPVAIASMEMRPEQTLGRMIKQFWATPLPPPSDLNRALDWMSGKLWIYDLLGNVATTKLLELAEFSVRRHGVRHFIIDSLMKCDVGNDDYDGQRRFLNTLTTFGRNHNCHMHVIAHPRKHDEERPIGRVAVSGSGDISNQADNVLSVWRNKAKERHEPAWTERDAIVLCDKQRETGWEGYIELEFLKQIEQFMIPGDGAKKYHESAFPKVQQAELIQDEEDHQYEV